jgi:hypothetical protein
MQTDPLLQWTKLRTHPVKDLVMAILKMDKHWDIRSHAFLRYGNIKFLRGLFCWFFELNKISLNMQNLSISTYIIRVSVDAVSLFLDEICK